MSLPWRAVVLRYFEEAMRTTPKIHALIAVPYMRTELQLRFAWCMIGLTRGENDSEEKKKSKQKSVPDKEHERSDNQRGSSSSVREAKRRSLFPPVHGRTSFKASIEHLCQDAERRRWTSESLALASTAGYASKQTNLIKHERTCGTRTHKENRRNKGILKQRAEAHLGIYGSTAEVQ